MAFPLPYWYALLEVQRQRLTEHESRLFMHYMVADVVEVEIDRTSRTHPAQATGGERH